MDICFVLVSNLLPVSFAIFMLYMLKLFLLTLFIRFNGSMMFEYALVALYNLIFTSLPIIFLGIWDQDVDAKVSDLYPEMYRMGLRNDKFKPWRFYLTVFDAIFQSSVCFFFPYMLLLGGPLEPMGRDQNGMYELGTIISSIVVIVANLFVLTSLYSFTWIQILIFSLSILVYYAFVCIYAQFNTFIFAGQDVLFSTGFYWMVLILTIVACYVPRISAMHLLHQYYPYDNDIVREQELVLHNGRSSYSSQPGPESSVETKFQAGDETSSNDKTKRFNLNDNNSNTTSQVNYPPIQDLPNSIA